MINIDRSDRGLFKMTMKKKLVAAVLALALAGTQAADASIFVVRAFNNSSSGGTGVATYVMTAGDSLSVNVDPGDLWNAGALPRWSNADGLVVDLFATGTDESGQLAGIKIGTPFPLWTQSGLTAPFGSLVGEIGGQYKLLGTTFVGTAWNTGTLNLYYWDSNFGDNTQQIAADVRVPEPSTVGLIVLSLVSLFGFGLVRRRTQP